MVAGIVTDGVPPEPPPVPRFLGNPTNGPNSPVEALAALQPGVATFIEIAFPDSLVASGAATAVGPVLDVVSSLDFGVLFEMELIGCSTT